LVKGKKSSAKIRNWIIAITIWTFLIALVISFVSEIIVVNVNLIFAAILLILIIFIGVFFDAIGVAVTAATQIPLNSMSSKRIKGAREAVELVKNADRVANFCNDVIGDITGIVSGAIGAVIIFRLLTGNPTMEDTLFSVIITGLIAALTVGGKALGKNIALKNSNLIVLKSGFVVYLFNYIFRRRR